MTPAERKAAFRYKADLEGRTLSAAAQEACNCTWFHLSEGIADKIERPLSADVKEKFASYIGKTVSEVFGTAEAA